MSIFGVFASLILVWSLVSWNRKWTNPVLDEREREIRSQVRVSICKTVEIAQTVLLAYVLLASLLKLPQPSAFLVLCLAAGTGCAAEALANYRLRRDDALA